MGGLATYTARMARLMAENNIEVHVFVFTDIRNDLIWDKGVCIHHIKRQRQSRLSSLVSRALVRIGLDGFNHYLKLQRDATQAARYIRIFSSIRQFDVLQYSDYLGIGLKINKKNINSLLVRCSSAIDLYMKADQRTCAKSQAQIKAELQSIKKSDIVVSPSQLVADHYSTLLRRRVEFVAPPAYLEAEISDTIPSWLPSSYLVHYAGWLLERKGSDLVLDAMSIALSKCPELRLVLIGSMTPAIQEKYIKILSLHSSSIMHIEPLPKNILYGIVQNSKGVILPSRVDNTPNTLLEALLLNSSVIVGKDSSLDKVVQGYEGAIILNEYCPEQLSELIIQMWVNDNCRQSDRTPWLLTAGGKVFEPSNALRRHLDVAQNFSHRQSNR